MTRSARKALLWATLGVAVAVLVWFRAEGAPPVVEGPARLVIGRDPTTVELSLSDEGSGVRSAVAHLIHSRGETVVLDEVYPGNLATGGDTGATRTATLTFDSKQLDLAEGDGFLRLVVRDWSWRDTLGGNAAHLEIPVRVDRKPPRISIASGLTYVRRGGAGAVTYRLSEPTQRDGVKVADAFFRSYPAPGDPERRVALFAVPTDAPPKPAIRVVAVDEAGNEGSAGWSVVVKERSLPAASVTLPASFLENTVRPMASQQGIPDDDLQAAFREINTTVREANETRIRELIADSEDEPHWTGAFQQLPNSAVTSRFAEQRTYFVGGVENSKATHFGYDLAATSAGPITASNAGRVVFADELGIYGNCVVLDHGMGLATLYGHLSRIDVAPGDRVEKGQVLGLSGATGLAGGDHLHFGVLVGNTYVDPVEWWDAEWVRTHVEVHLNPSSP